MLDPEDVGTIAEVERTVPDEPLGELLFIL
jgi:hypothetical protein